MKSKRLTLQVQSSLRPLNKLKTKTVRIADVRFRCIYATERQRQGQRERGINAKYNCLLTAFNHTCMMQRLNELLISCEKKWWSQLQFLFNATDLHIADKST